MTLEDFLTIIRSAGNNQHVKAALQAYRSTITLADLHAERDRQKAMKIEWMKLLDDFGKDSASTCRIKPIYLTP